MSQNVVKINCVNTHAKHCTCTFDFCSVEFSNFKLLSMKTELTVHELRLGGGVLYMFGGACLCLNS